MTEDDRVREKDGISFPLGDEKPGRGGRERRRMIGRSRRQRQTKTPTQA